MAGKEENPHRAGWGLNVMTRPRHQDGGAKPTVAVTATAKQTP